MSQMGGDVALPLPARSDSWWRSLRRGRASATPEAVREPTAYTGVRDVARPAYHLDAEQLRAEEIGRADGTAGLRDPDGFERVPAAAQAILAHAEGDLAVLRSSYVQARANVSRRQTKLPIDIAALEAQIEELKAGLELNGEGLDRLPRRRYGWLRVGRWSAFLGIAALAGADVLLTKFGLIAGSDLIREWEAWTVSVLIGILLLGGGIGKAYLDSMRADTRSDDARTDRGPRDQSLKRLSWWILLSTGVVLAGLGAARIRLILEDPEGIELVVAGGAFVAVTGAAVLVPALTYFLARFLFGARDRNRLLGSRARLESELGPLRNQLLRLRTELAGIPTEYDRARDAHAASALASNCRSREILMAYWRGFGHVRSIEAPELESLHSQDLRLLQRLATEVTR